jgi:hypothetical protein
VPQREHSHNATASHAAIEFILLHTAVYALYIVEQRVFLFLQPELLQPELLRKQPIPEQ